MSSGDSGLMKSCTFEKSRKVSRQLAVISPKPVLNLLKGWIHGIWQQQQLAEGHRYQRLTGRQVPATQQASAKRRLTDLDVIARHSNS